MGIAHHYDMVRRRDSEEPGLEREVLGKLGNCTIMESKGRVGFRRAEQKGQGPCIWQLGSP